VQTERRPDAVCMLFALPAVLAAACVRRLPHSVGLWLGAALTRVECLGHPELYKALSGTHPSLQQRPIVCMAGMGLKGCCLGGRSRHCRRWLAAARPTHAGAAQVAAPGRRGAAGSRGAAPGGRGRGRAGPGLLGRRAGLLLCAGAATQEPFPVPTRPHTYTTCRLLLRAGAAACVRPAAQARSRVARARRAERARACTRLSAMQRLRARTSGAAASLASCARVAKPMRRTGPALAKPIYEASGHAGTCRRTPDASHCCTARCSQTMLPGLPCAYRRIITVCAARAALGFQPWRCAGARGAA